MKNLTFEEFQNRVAQVDRAKRIFGEITRKNITKAFDAYLDILAEDENEKIALGITKKKLGGGFPSFLDLYKCPECPECGATLKLRRVTLPEGPANLNGWKSCWYCEKDNCIYEEYMLQSVNDIIMTLEKREDA